MKVLVVSAMADEGGDFLVEERVVETLTRSGHNVSVVRTADDGFSEPMSANERRVYHEEGENILSGGVQRSVDELAVAEGLLFCYRTSADMAPPQIKNWLDRVLLPGVAFGFNDKGKVRPGMTQINRLGLVTVAPARLRPSEASRRTILWTIRLNCGLQCKRSFVSAPTSADLVSDVNRKIGRW